MASTTQTYFTLSDGADLAYDLHGEEHLGKKGVLPFVLMGGSSNTKVDWARLLPHLSQSRPILTFDYRGIGLSTYSTPARDDILTIESMARDTIDLIQSFGWREIDILGFSMGGIILQQILLFHSHPTTHIETPLFFRIQHAILSATFASSLPLTPFQGGHFKIPPPRIVGQELTAEQKKELARPYLDASLGYKWVASPENRERYEIWLENSITNRPSRTIRKQREMISTFSFVDDLQYIDRSIKILVIHGKDDVVAPFSKAREIVQACPQAQLVPIGLRKGQVPSYAFGHLWHEYFDVDIWLGVIESFLMDESVEPMVHQARLYQPSKDTHNIRITSHAYTWKTTLLRVFVLKHP